MAKPPKRHFDWNEEERQLSEAFFQHDSDAWAYRASVRVLIQELLSKLPEENLNREKIAERLLQLVLRDNHYYDEIAKEIDADTALHRVVVAHNVSQVSESTRKDIRAILEDSSIQHSGWSLREQSDEILKWIDTYPYPFEKDPSTPYTKPQSDWLQKYMPAILVYLKGSSLCSLVCMARTAWPPAQVETPTSQDRDESDSSFDSIDQFFHLATAPVGLKNAILAYYHGISVKTLSNKYLQNQLPKSIRQPRSSS